MHTCQYVLEIKEGMKCSYQILDSSTLSCNQYEQQRKPETNIGKMSVLKKVDYLVRQVKKLGGKQQYN
jgi:hypothetical protein